MNKAQKASLEVVIKGLINDDSKAAGEALHEYLRGKAQSILVGEQDEMEDEPVEKKARVSDEDMDDEEPVEKKASSDDEDMDDDEGEDEDMDDEMSMEEEEKAKKKKKAKC